MADANKKKSANWANLRTIIIFCIIKSWFCARTLFDCESSRIDRYVMEVCFISILMINANLLMAFKYILHFTRFLYCWIVPLQQLGEEAIIW